MSSKKYWCDVCEAYVPSACFDGDCPVRDVTDEFQEDDSDEVSAIDFHSFENDSILNSFNDEDNNNENTG